MSYALRLRRAGEDDIYLCDERGVGHWNEVWIIFWKGEQLVSE